MFNKIKLQLYKLVTTDMIFLYYLKSEIVSAINASITS
jgi:hypothetical protein